LKALTDLGEELKEKALLVQVIPRSQNKDEAAESLLELERLADTAGAEVVGCVTQCRDKPTPNLLVGEGKVQEIDLACGYGNANLVVFDNDLTAAQVNNLDLALGIKVIDRTELILQIFARRASSAQSKTQVELAQLEYLVSRIPVSHKQQRFQGGIGMKGPGESPFQLRNAPMRKRIRLLKKRLEQIRARQSRTRVRRPWPSVSLVGYTNAGKSTLLNALSSSHAYVDDRLFATLDTKTRRVHLAEGRDILLSDTVGFIRHLPHGLVASFRSTLDVAVEADLLVLVADASHAAVFDHWKVVRETLASMGADQCPSLLVLNKCDRRVDGDACEQFRREHPDVMMVSARRGDGLSEMKDRILAILEAQGSFVKECSTS